MKSLFYRKASLLPLLMGCWLLFLLAACGSTAATGSGNPTSIVTPVATLTTPATKLVLTFECHGGKTSNEGFNPGGTHERVCVQTLPGASLTIHVTYCTGSVDQSPALKGTFTADTSGSYEWSWTPKATCQGNPAGASGFWKGTAQVTATLSGQHVTSNLEFGV